MLPKLLATLLHTLFWAIPAYIIHPWAGIAFLVLGVIWFFVNPARVTWLPRRGGIFGRARQVRRLLITLFYWAVGTAAISLLAWLVRSAWTLWIRP